MSDDAETWTLQVEWVAGDRAAGIEPGGFRLRLIEAAIAADADNLERLRRGFPELVRAVRAWRSR